MGNATGITRRQAITAAGGAVLAASVASLPGMTAGARAGARVDVVGAGLAGLACAARLVAAGVDVRIWEARDRLGGRTLTDLNLVPGAWVECGGEFIDAGHSAMRRLCADLGISLQDLQQLDIPGTSRDLVAGRVHRGAWASGPDARLANRAARDLRAVGTTRLGRMSAAAWLARAITGWPSSAFARYGAALVRGEYGVEPLALSAEWLVNDLAGDAGADEHADGAERYRIDGGTVRLVTSLERSIGAGRITRGARLVAVTVSGGRASLAIDGPGGLRTEATDRVVITLPPRVLADVDMRRSGVPRDVVRSIQAIGMGTNAKLIIPFDDPAWESRGWNGDGTSDTALGSTWQATMGQRADGVALTTLVGGLPGVRIPGPDHGPATAASVAERLALVGRVAPGAQDSARSGAVVHAWARDRFARGSYSAARPGQDSTWPDFGRPYGLVHFAGEHTDEDYSGFMEGAVRSGQRAAQQVLARL
ncbi:MAG: FAD-dependent oxidoreductase [Acidobacteria bacterium]|nr:FAD-dependent oxidoreductase [Acidobacteriota bacterium]